MGYPPIEELLPKSGMSIYKLIRMASQRAMELADGKKPLIELPANTKTATLALEEIKAGMVVLKEVSDQLKPQPKSKEAKKNTAEEESELSSV